MGEWLEPLLTAYVAYLPWLLFAVGLVFVILGATMGRRNRRALIIGLSMTAIASMWMLLQMLYHRA